MHSDRPAFLVFIHRNEHSRLVSIFGRGIEDYMIKIHK